MGLFDGITSALGIGGVPGDNLKNPVDAETLAAANTGVKTGLQQQQDLINALRAQNGIANQGSVFGQEQDLANTFGQQAQGLGPNPALAQLNQQTGNNVAQQAALMASQRGASQNVGLIARQAGQQGAGVQQQAVGQEATLQAQQQLAAQQALQQQQALMAGTAGNQVNEQQNATNSYQQGALQQQGNVYGAQSNYNNAQIQNQGLQNQAIGSLLSAGSSVAAAGAGGKAHGGEITPFDAVKAIYHPNMAHGGKVPVMVSPGEKYLDPKDAKEVAKGEKSPMSTGKTFGGKAAVKGDSPKNDTVKAELETGGVVIPRTVMQSENPAQAAADFVAKHLREKGSDMGGSEHEDFHNALKMAISSRGKR